MKRPIKSILKDITINLKNENKDGIISNIFDIYETLKLKPNKELIRLREELNY